MHFCFWLTFTKISVFSGYSLLVLSVDLKWVDPRNHFFNLQKWAKQHNTKWIQNNSLSKVFEYLVNITEWSRNIGGGLWNHRNVNNKRLKSDYSSSKNSQFFQSFLILRTAVDTGWKPGQKSVSRGAGERGGGGGVLKREQLTIEEVFVLPVHLSCCRECTWSSSSFFEARSDATSEDGLATRQESGFLETL